MKQPILISAGLALTMSLTPLSAQVAEDVARIEVLQGWRDADGTHNGALAIRLAPGWKTYWRAAGEGGIPPHFDWSASGNLDSLEIHFPVPKVFDQNGMRSYGYENQVILPFRAQPTDRADDIRLAGEIEIGVCLDICVPVTLDVTDMLPPSASEGADIIRAALADRPLSAEEAGIGEMTCRIEPISDGLRVSAEIAGGRLDKVLAAVMELPDRSIWISETDIQTRGGTLIATADMVPPEAAPFFLARDSLRVTLLGGTQAVEIVGCGGG